MESWRNMDNLKILYEGRGEQDTHDRKDTELPYPLYEENVDAILRSIFHNAVTYMSYGRNLGEDCKERSFDLQMESNIYSLVGARGAGKTTAMREVCWVLEKLSQGAYCQAWMEKVIQSEDERNILKNRRFCFHILKQIDAALLNDKEDLMELILWNLFNDYKKRYMNQCCGKEHNQTLIMDINKMFDELFRSYRSTGNRDPEDYTLATFSGKGGDSTYLTEKITELLGLIEQLQGDNCICDYYVIQIDDLDLNLHHGYEMLQQLQKYFCDYRILILVTMDYEQLYYVCAEYFNSNMKLAESEYASEYEISHSRTLANDIMTKVFPIQQRYFLPDMKKRSKRMQIEIKGTNELIYVKQYMMERIADCMGIHYDAVGHKRHFCEPNTVRQLVNYNRFLDLMNVINFEQLVPIANETDGTDEEREYNARELFYYDQNHNRFNEDIVNRQAQTTLTPNQRRFFKQFLDLPLERRAGYLTKAGDVPKLSFRDSYNENSDKDYRYGTLLENIYKWGRDEYENKPLISCILASFTSEMVREYISYCYHPDMGKKQQAKERLVKFMGNSFGNKWIGERIFPDLEWQFPRQNEGIENVAYFRTRIALLGFEDRAGIEDLEIFLSLESLRELKENDNYKADKWKSVLDRWFKQSSVVQLIEIMDMFLVHKKKNQYPAARVIFELMHSMESEESVIVLGDVEELKPDDMLIRIQFRGDYSLDLMGSAPKSMNYSLVKKEIHSQMVDGLSSCLNAYLGVKERTTRKKEVNPIIIQCVQKYSIFADYNDIDKLVCNFPFYDLDLSYNVIKRINDNENKVIKQEEIYDELIRIYEQIYALLLEEGEKYLHTRYTYADDFINSPYIHALCSYKDNSGDKENIREQKRKMREYISRIWYDMMPRKKKVGKPEEPEGPTK